jgi:hypothetical protein
MSDNKSKSITSKIVERERLLPAIRYTAPLVAAFNALMGVNVESGFRSVGTRLMQSLYPKIRDGVAKLCGQRGTPGATGKWKALLGLRQSDLTDAQREDELLALLTARAMPNERMIMACYMLDALAKAELENACVLAYGDEPGKAFAQIVKSVAKFLDVSSEIVEADIKKYAGKTANLTSTASDAITDSRNAAAASILKMLSE